MIIVQAEETLVLIADERHAVETHGTFRALEARQVIRLAERLQNLERNNDGYPVKSHEHRARRRTVSVIRWLHALQCSRV